MNVQNDLVEYARDILKKVIIQGDIKSLHDSLVDELRDVLTIQILAQRISKIDEISEIRNATEPKLNLLSPGFWTFDIPVIIKSTEWLAHFSINSSHKINDFNFSQKPHFIPASYFNPHKVICQQLSDLPQIYYIKPVKRKTVKLPIAVFIHAAVQLDLDGHMGMRYPFRDLDFLAQHKVGLIRNSYENYGEPDTVVCIALKSIDAALSLEEHESITLILHGFAALFLPNILEKRGSLISKIILINPAWEALPESNLENMSIDKVKCDLPIMLIGCENDQIMIKDHFDMWKEALGNSYALWFENCDHFLMRALRIPTENDYTVEGHVEEKVMRKMIQWMKQ
ncbi:hypothetical protein GPJ56_002006 [Histomonas meleagridis]|uniref:uncharacterized protein n=1 Tax=Histomonas meleagridis TaxID=135588 RepID=UPI00355937ED|nr:hypothetical protein GPJ56_002006 [Histomonas meleagridis]KAH0800917.1 hypothetical protein GO595_006233 [Histomonas meleagridis]